MFSSPVFYVWLAWLLALAVFAVVRYKTRQHEEHQQEERRQQREAKRDARGQRSGVGVRRQLSRPSLSADYRDQLGAAGLIRPAADPDTTADPATSM